MIIRLIQLFWSPAQQSIATLVLKYGRCGKLIIINTMIADDEEDGFVF